MCCKMYRVPHLPKGTKRSPAKKSDILLQGLGGSLLEGTLGENVPKVGTGGWTLSTLLA